VIAPDLPGFGFTEVPAERKYAYTFDSLAKTIEAFTDALNLQRYALYIFDFGAPTGLRLAVSRPDRVSAIVSQNGNAYEEGLGAPWAALKKWWSEETPDNRQIIRKALGADGIRYQYFTGMSEPERISPESYTLDIALVERPGNMDIQLDLHLDYRSNDLPQVSRVLPDTPTAIARDLGKERPIFHTRRRRSLQEGHPFRFGSVRGRWPLRT
jgi:pimeloyl-ACP methyl ester carboxylesterase